MAYLCRGQLMTRNRAQHQPIGFEDVQHPFHLVGPLFTRFDHDGDYICVADSSQQTRRNTLRGYGRSIYQLDLHIVVAPNAWQRHSRSEGVICYFRIRMSGACQETALSSVGGSDDHDLPGIALGNMERVGPEWCLNKTQNFLAQWLALTGLGAANEEDAPGDLLHLSDGLVEFSLVGNGLSQALKLGLR